LTLAGYLAYSLVLRGTSFWFALIAAPLICVIVGVLVERNAGASALQARGRSTAC